jgi:hypothetical protein
VKICLMPVLVQGTLLLVSSSQAIIVGYGGVCFYGMLFSLPVASVSHIILHQKDASD